MDYLKPFNCVQTYELKLSEKVTDKTLYNTPTAYLQMVWLHPKCVLDIILNYIWW